MWADQITTWGGVLAVLGGLVLLGVRLYVGVLEAKIKKRELGED
jgi:hypothetical protein